MDDRFRSDARITAIRHRAVRIPLPRPLKAKAVQLDHSCFVLVDIETDAGHTGHAYLHAFPEVSVPVFRTLIGAMAPLLEGQPLAPQELHSLAMNRIGLWLGKEGAFTRALAGIDMGAWDALAKTRGLPLARLLGGELRPLPAYNSTGLSLGTLDELRREAPTLLAGGFTAVKMRLGYGSAADDVAAVRAVRGSLPPGAKVMSDYGQSLTPEEAMARCRALDGEGLAWIEDPIGYDDLDTHARIAAAIETPIQTGENLDGLPATARLFAARACDLVNFDVCHIGGVTAWLEAARLAHRHGIPVSSHTNPEFSTHLLAATPTAHWCEFFDWAAALQRAPLKPRDGSLTPTDVPGVGIAWDEDFLARHAIRD